MSFQINGDEWIPVTIFSAFLTFHPFSFPQNEVVELRNENGSKVSKLEEELALAHDDNEQLMKQIVKLTKYVHLYNQLLQWILC